METQAQVLKRNLFDPSRFMGSVLIGVVSGAAGGLAAGIGARLAMRGVALASGTTPVFTPGGSLFIAGLGAVMGMWIGILFAFLMPVLPGSHARKGLFFGLVSGLVLAGLTLAVEQEGELALAPMWMVTLMFAALPLIYGIIVGLVTARLANAPVELSGDSPAFIRTAGTLTLVLAALSLVCEALVAFRQLSILNLTFEVMRAVSQAGGASLVLAMLFGTAGLIRSGAAGRSRLAKIGLGITLATTGLLGLVAISGNLDLMHVHGLIRLSAEITTSSDPLPILRSGRWKGWKAYLVLVIGIIPPVSLVLLNPSLPLISGGGTLPNRTITAYVLGVLFALCWLLVGSALRSSLSQEEPGDEMGSVVDSTLLPDID